MLSRSATLRIRIRGGPIAESSPPDKCWCLAQHRSAAQGDDVSMLLAVSQQSCGGGSRTKTAKAHVLHRSHPVRVPLLHHLLSAHDSCLSSLQAMGFFLERSDKEGFMWLTLLPLNMDLTMTFLIGGWLESSSGGSNRARCGGFTLGPLVPGGFLQAQQAGPEGARGSIRKFQHQHLLVWS